MEEEIDGGAETIGKPVKATDLMEMLQSIQRQITMAENTRREELREWTHWRGQMSAGLANLSERATELHRMYGQAIEVLPIAKRTEEHVDDILDWLHQGGHVAKRRKV